MNKTKLFASMVIIGLAFQTANAAYPEIDCSTDPVFSQNKCNQCFNWAEKWEWEAVWMLSDLYVNKTANPKLVYKEEQTMPFMLNLAWDKTSWSQIPWADNFWEYTPEFDALFSSWQEAYVIAPAKEVSRIKSKTWYAYKLDKNTAAKWENVWLLVYPVVSHDLVNNEVSVETVEHRECVLFKSWAPAATPAPTPVEKQPVKELPQTWPESFLLLGLALLLALWLFGLKKKNS